MTITEDEIRTALQRAAARSDRDADPAPAALPLARPPKHRSRVLAVAAAVLCALGVLGGMAFWVRSGDERVHSGPASAPVDPPTSTEPVATTTSAPLAPVQVRVLNGSGTSGAAAALTAEVAALGYRTGSVSNAPEQYEISEVRFLDGYADAARELAERLGISITDPLPAGSILGEDDPTDANVVVIIGVDLAAPPN